MIEILTRKEFARYWNLKRPGLGDADSALWEPEHYESLAKPSNWFIYANGPAAKMEWDKSKYWSWVRKHCQGSVLCYSASEEGEWWGFENHDDIVLWVLRWS